MSECWRERERERPREREKQRQREREREGGRNKETKEERKTEIPRERETEAMTLCHLRHQRCFFKLSTPLRRFLNSVDLIWTFYLYRASISISRQIPLAGKERSYNQAMEI